MTRSGAVLGAMVLVAAAGAAALAQSPEHGRHPARHARAVQAMSDANILAEMKGGDSVEVVLSEWVRARTSNAALRAYTETLTRDHSKGVREVDALARRVHITPVSPPNDTTWLHNRHVEDRLSALKGFDFDTAASRHWIRDHRNDMADAERMMRAAHDAAVRRGLEGEMPTLREHLRLAETLTRTLDREHGTMARRARR